MGGRLLYLNFCKIYLILDCLCALHGQWLVTPGLSLLGMKMTLHIKVGVFFCQCESAQILHQCISISCIKSLSQHLYADFSQISKKLATLNYFRPVEVTIQSLILGRSRTGVVYIYMKMFAQQQWIFYILVKTKLVMFFLCRFLSSIKLSHGIHITLCSSNNR